MDSVRARHVFLWECPTCKASNEVKCQPIELDDEMLRQMHGLEEWQQVPEGLGGEAMKLPDTVNCKCGGMFKLDSPWDNDEGQEFEGDDDPDLN